MAVAEMSQVFSKLCSETSSGKLIFKDDCAFVTAHLEIFHCTHHSVIPKPDLYFTFCYTLNALSERTSK